MKNFRKVLALILVVATLFSFAAMTSAKEYTDADKVSYDEAVEVLSAIGILNGYDDGSFKPTDNIAREEMAKMVAVLSNAGDDVSDLYASACKFADTKDRWSASYVAYCNETGIVAGRNASTFDPRGRVTGIETAKMLLCLLGFDATAQGYVGTNWKTNVLRDAKDAGLLSGFAADYDIAKAITREESAQMMLNALNAYMVVGVLSDNIIKVTNSFVWDTDWITLPDAEKNGFLIMDNNVIMSNKQLWTIYGNLERVDDFDCYHNPGVKWTFKNDKGNVLFEKVYTVAPDYSYTKAATLSTDLSAEIKAGNYEYVVYVNGVYAEYDDVTTQKMKDVAEAYTGNGLEVNVFVNDATKVVLITVKVTYIDKVVSLSNHDDVFTLDHDAYSNVDSFDNSEYDFAVDDIVLYWVCDGTCADCDGHLHAAKKATVVNGEAEEVGDTDKYDNGYAVVGGKTYEYAESFGVEIYDEGKMGTQEVWNSRNLDTTYDLYLDEFGYIMYWEEHVDSIEWTYAYAVEGTLSYDQSTGNPYNDGTKYYVDMRDFETGALHEDVRIDKDMYDAIEDRTYDDGHSALENKIGALVCYQVIDGVATLKTDAFGNTWNIGMADMPSTTGAVLTADGDVKGTYGMHYGSDDTVYMIRTRDYSKEGEYVYTIKSHDEIDTALKGYITEGDKDNDRIVSLQYFTTTSPNGVSYLTYVFIDAMFSETAQRAYVYDHAGWKTVNYFVNEVGQVELYNAYINGEDVYMVAFDGTPGKRAALGLYTADLSVIGLTVDNVPVYGAVGGEIPTIVMDHTLYYYKGHLSVAVPGSNKYVSYNIDDKAFAVVTLCDDKDGTTYKLETIEDINEFFEKHGTKVEVRPDDDDDGNNETVVYYELDTTWLVNSNGVIGNSLGSVSSDLTEIYVIVGDTN